MAFQNVMIHYLDNEPHGVRVIQVEGSVIEALVIPRELLRAAKDIANALPERGVYFLVEGREGKHLPKVYVGQTRTGINRLYDHNAKKADWTQAVMFLSKDDHFPLDVISALEKVAIDSVVKCGRYESDNKVDPKFRIGMYQEQTIDNYFATIKFVMATLGWSIDTKDSISQGEWHTTRNGIMAFGDYADGRFDLLPGSQIDLSRKVNLLSYNELREALVESGDIVVDRDGFGVLKKIVTFKTPSGASDFVLGGSTNGWTEWKNMKGEKLDSIRKK